MSQRHQHSTRKRADFLGGSCLTSDLGTPTSGDNAEDSRGTTSWCGRPQGGGRAGPPVAAGSQHWASAPSASREGDPGRQMGEGASPATSADPRVLRQDAGGQTGDGQPRHTDPWGGWGPLGDAGAHSPGGDHPMPTWVSSPPVAQGVSPAKHRHRHTPPLDAVEEGPSPAGVLPVGPCSDRGHRGRAARVWLPPGTIDGRRHRAVPSGGVAARRGPVALSGRPPCLR